VPKYTAKIDYKCTANAVFLIDKASVTADVIGKILNILDANLDYTV